MSYPAHIPPMVSIATSADPKAELQGIFSRLEKIERVLWGKPAVETLYCSFCGKSQHEVPHLIAGPKAFICNECVDLCVDVIAERRS